LAEQIGELGWRQDGRVAVRPCTVERPSKFTPAKDGKFKFLVRNRGPGANKVTLEVKVAK